jgi:8-oxo-dGTP pyrophosphatase MutT (NUDIX family)
MNYFNKNNIVCNNCGKSGHTQKQCTEPITSLGIICIKMDKEKMDKCIDKLVHKEEFDVKNNIVVNINNNPIDETNINILNSDIEYLIVRRKHSLGYIEFIRGRYDVNKKESIFHLISQMSPEEIEFLKTKEFKELWEEVWKKTSYNKMYLKEMEDSLEKFKLLNDAKFFDQEFVKHYSEPEWGFPKGRRNQNEKNLKCALREFYEETGIVKSNLLILNKFFPISETFHGTNGVLYKHIYYIALYDSEDEIGLDKIHEDQLTEIGDIKWKTVKDCLKLFRPYHEEKKKVLVSLHNYLTNIIDLD